MKNYHDRIIYQKVLSDLQLFSDNFTFFIFSKNQSKSF